MATGAWGMTMATGQRTMIGPYTVVSERQGMRGRYIGVVKNGPVIAHVTLNFSGKGAKDRAFQAAKKWAVTHATADPTGSRAAGAGTE